MVTSIEIKTDDEYYSHESKINCFSYSFFPIFSLYNFVSITCNLKDTIQAHFPPIFFLVVGEGQEKP